MFQSWSKIVFWCPSFLLQCYPKSLHTFHQHFFVNSYLHTHMNHHDSQFSPWSSFYWCQSQNSLTGMQIDTAPRFSFPVETRTLRRQQTENESQMRFMHAKTKHIMIFCFIFSDLHQGLGFRIPHECSHPFSVLSWVWNCLVLWTVSVKL